MIYHYTDRLNAADICRDKVIRAAPITLHRDLFARDEGYTTEPIVWLTINPILDGTVVAKMVAGGWKEMVGNLWRFGVADDYAPLGLGDFCEATGIDPDWWRMAVQTGELAGSHYSTWRIFRGDIPAPDWVAVEKLLAINSGHTQWEPL